MTKAVDYLKIVKEFYPHVELLDELSKHILSVVFKEEAVEIYCSLWGVLKERMIKSDMAYNDAMQSLIKLVDKENRKSSLVTYFFYDDLPNPQLN
jgi:hypothetical protein